MSERTICGGCNCRVSVKLQHPDDHNCVLIADLKKDFNLVLSEIQNDYERRIKNLDKKLQETDHVANCQAETIGILCTKVNKLEKELSNCIDVKLLYSDRQARETWQSGVEVMIDTLHARVTDMDFMLKNSLLCVDNSHAEENAKKFGLASIGDLNKMVSQHLEDNIEVKCQSTGTIKIHHPSRKHLEKKLAEKNKQYRYLVERLDHLTHAVSELNPGLDMSLHFDSDASESSEEAGINHLWISAKAHADALSRGLAKKEKRIAELEGQLCMRNHECQAALNESNNLRAIVAELSKENETLRDGLSAVRQLEKLFNGDVKTEVINGGCKL